MQIVKVPQLIQTLFPSIIWKGKTDEKILHLTFDDSPTPEFTFWILNLLEKLNIKATFFCVGESAERYPKIILSILDKGHQIGNHTYSHKNGFLSSTKSYLDNIERCKKILPSTTLFRPPYGKIYPWQIRKIKENYKIVMWDIVSYDFHKNKAPIKTASVSQARKSVYSTSVNLSDKYSTKLENLFKQIKKMAPKRGH